MTMTMTKSEIATSGKRYAYFATIDDDQRRVVAIVTENEPGFRTLWHVFESKADAEEPARWRNKRIGVKPRDRTSCVELAGNLDLKSNIQVL